MPLPQFNVLPVFTLTEDCPPSTSEKLIIKEEAYDDSPIDISGPIGESLSQKIELRT
jgi:hypothetical protein